MEKSKSGTGMSKHQELYKGRSPHWKETYRKRCFARLKNSRQSFLSRFRNQENKDESMVNHVMTEEWKKLRSENEGLPQLKENVDLDIEDIGNIEIDEILSVFESIREELIIEEQQILSEYDAGIQFDEASLCATLDCLKTDDVLCPICQKHPLMINRGVIFCKCGTRIDTEQDCITLDNVRLSLQTGTEIHSEMCQSKPNYAVIDQLGIDNLIISCKTCDFMHIVV